MYGVIFFIVFAIVIGMIIFMVSYLDRFSNDIYYVHAWEQYELELIS